MKKRSEPKPIHAIELLAKIDATKCGKVKVYGQKPMKPVKAWALVVKDTGELVICNDTDRVSGGILESEDEARANLNGGERIARVVITEVRGKR